jgi:hypothetical protein
MSWLLRDGDVLASVEDRRRGWQASLQGALVLRGPAVVQTLTGNHARALDVAWCTQAQLDSGRPALRVRRISMVGPRRVSPPHLGSGGLVVAPAGTFERWQLHVGDCLEVRGPEVNRN